MVINNIKYLISPVTELLSSRESIERMAELEDVLGHNLVPTQQLSSVNNGKKVCDILLVETSIKNDPDFEVELFKLCEDLDLEVIVKVWGDNSCSLCDATLPNQVTMELGRLALAKGHEEQLYVTGDERIFTMVTRGDKEYE